MYKLIRRISSSFFPRPDRPWSEDATSTAPQIGRKRRYSSTEPDDEASSSTAKKHRLDLTEAQGAEPATKEDTLKEAEAVKEVTKGVKEVEIADGLDKPSNTASDAAIAAAVPLPESPELNAQKESTEVTDVPEVSASQKTEIIDEEGPVDEQVEEVKEAAEGEPAVDEVVVNGVHEEKVSEGETVVAPVEKSPVKTPVAPDVAEVATPLDEPEATAPSPTKDSSEEIKPSNDS
ncbi:hypothetical protein C8Q75DRAFT_730645 [Abortiporus biennis]|nr:hypothetical protein C8Q75DRAFT_730645 [Abortiporus biennis]